MREWFGQGIGRKGGLMELHSKAAESIRGVLGFKYRRGKSRILRGTKKCLAWPSQ